MENLQNQADCQTKVLQRLSRANVLHLMGVGDNFQVFLETF